jgi:hypothetical protein
VVDGNDQTAWTTSSAASGQTVEVDLLADFQLVHIQITFDSTRFPYNWTVLSRYIQGTFREHSGNIQ